MGYNARENNHIYVFPMGKGLNINNGRIDTSSELCFSNIASCILFRAATETHQKREKKNSKGLWFKDKLSSNHTWSHMVPVLNNAANVHNNSCMHQQLDHQL